MPAVIVLMFALLFSTAARAGWVRADTERFTIFLEGTVQEARTYAFQLERFHAAAMHILSLPEDHARTQRRFEVVVMRSQAQLAKVNPALPESYIGVYQACRDGVVAFAAKESRNGQSSSDAAREVIFHEVAHRLMFEHLGAAYPKWFVEGFAEFLSAVQISGFGAGLIGAKPLQRRQIASGAGASLSYAKLLAAVEPDPKTEAFFYARSWALAHYMLTDRARVASLTTYLDGVSKGADPVRSFESTTGIPVDRLAKRIEQHWWDAEPYWVGDFVSRADDFRAEITWLSDAQGEVLLTDAALRVCPPAAHGRALLDELRKLRAQRDKPAIELRLALARAELDWGDVDAAKSELDAAFAEKPRKFEVLHLLGRTLTKQALTGPADQWQSRFGAASTHYFQAAKLNKLDAPNNYRIALLPWKSRTEPDLLTAARNARALEPTVPEYAVLEALIDLEAGDRALAVQALRPIAANPHNPELSARMRRAIEAIEAGQGVQAVSDILTEGKASAADAGRDTAAKP